MAKPKHKITGLRLHQKGDTFTLSALTKSPRGTSVPFTKLAFKSEGKDRTKRMKAIETAIDKILGKTE